jgi:hypothetical protein
MTTYRRFLTRSGEAGKNVSRGYIHTYLTVCYIFKVQNKHFPLFITEKVRILTRGYASIHDRNATVDSKSVKIL